MVDGEKGMVIYKPKPGEVSYYKYFSRQAGMVIYKPKPGEVIYYKYFSRQVRDIYLSFPLGYLEFLGEVQFHGGADIYPMGYQMRAYLSMRGGDYGEAMLTKNPWGRVDIHVRQKLFPKDVWMHYELNVADPELWWSATTMNFKKKLKWAPDY